MPNVEATGATPALLSLQPANEFVPPAAPGMIDAVEPIISHDPSAPAASGIDGLEPPQGRSQTPMPDGMCPPELLPQLKSELAAEVDEVCKQVADKKTSLAQLKPAAASAVFTQGASLVVSITKDELRELVADSIVKLNASKPQSSVQDAIDKEQLQNGTTDLLHTIEGAVPSRRSDRRTVCDKVEAWSRLACDRPWSECIEVARALRQFNKKACVRPIIVTGGGCPVFFSRTKYVLEFYERYAYAVACAKTDSQGVRKECIDVLKSELRLRKPMYLKYPKGESVSRTVRKFEPDYVDFADWRHMRLVYACMQVRSKAYLELKKDYLGSDAHRLEIKDIGGFNEQVNQGDRKNLETFKKMTQRYDFIGWRN